MKTGWNFHELYLWHDTGAAAQFFPAGLTIEPGEHAENAATKRRFKNLMEVSGLTDQLVSLKSTPMTEDDLARFHTRDYIRRIKAESDHRGGDASPLTPFGRGSYEIACLAAGGTFAVMDAVLSGTIDNGYALVRPPGHHAESAKGMGFCLFGNVAVAVMHAQAVHGVGRVATVDWDVHHGNGTEACFYDRADTLTISLHQENCFPPDQGRPDARGKGRGEGFNLNISLLPGGGHQAYMDAFDLLVTPALRAFKPEIIVVASGLDANAFDPLARMQAHSETFRSLASKTKAIAAELCDGRLLAAHEGGYSEGYVPFCGLAVIEEFSGHRTPVQDPFLDILTQQQPPADFIAWQRARLEMQAQRLGN